MNYSSRAPGPESINSAERSFLGRLAGWSYERRRLVLVLWIGGLVAITVLAQGFGSRFQDNFSSGNSPSQQVQNILAARFPQTAGTTADVVIHTAGPVTSPATVATTTKMATALRSLPHVSGVASPFSPQATHQISAGGHIAFATVQFDQDQAAIAAATVNRVINTAKSFATPDLHVALGGQVISTAVSPAPGSSEGFGIVAAMIIMLIAFGSLVAMGLPILTALFGIAIGFAVEDLVSHILNVPTFAPEMLAMIGLGVGIDYALFIVTRYRQGLHEGREPKAAAVLALATSGRAVLFAGCTVIISLLGLFIVNLPFMQGLAVGAIAAVVLVMTAALTLLPAMLGFAGKAIDKLHVPGLLQSGAGRGDLRPGHELPDGRSGRTGGLRLGTSPRPTPTRPTTRPRRPGHVGVSAGERDPTSTRNCGRWRGSAVSPTSSSGTTWLPTSRWPRLHAPPSRRPRGGVGRRMRARCQTCTRPTAGAARTAGAP